MSLNVKTNALPIVCTTRLLLVVILLVATHGLAYPQDKPAQPQPHWIWGRQQSRSETLELRRSFQTVSPTRWARIKFAPISAGLTIRLNGREIASAEPYDSLQTLEIRTRLLPGIHTLAVEGAGVSGPSACFVKLAFEFEDGVRTSLVTDKSWIDRGGASANDLGPLDPGLIVPDERAVGIDIVDDYEQWKQAIDTKEGTDPTSFLVAPGFEIQRVRSAEPHEDSWVSMVFDSAGRIIIAKEQTGLLRMTLSELGTEVTQVEELENSLQECRGLAFVGQDLFANANNSKALYRLRATAAGFATPEVVCATSGGVGHGRNDLAVGDDQELYSIHGDSVDLPADALDLTSPYRQARRGNKTSEGHLLRIDPESGKVAVIAAGLRNPFGVDFNQHGDAFTYDADAEYDMGAPWYRPTRVSHLVTGGDYGWRGVTQAWPSYYHDHPDNARPSLDIGKGSPTAVKFGTRSRFPAPYQEALFILDWAYGRIMAVHMIPRGASYLMTSETFLKGRPLNVTDLDFGPEGDMYFVTGGRKTQSALYRVRYVGEAPEEAPELTPQQKSVRRFATNSRALRRELEQQLTEPEKVQLPRLWNLLSSADPWIRQAAVHLIERRPTDDWAQNALREPHVTTAVQGLSALARSGELQYRPAILQRMNLVLPMAELPSDRLAAIYVYWLCLQGEVDPALQAQVASALDHQYPSSRYEENRWLSELLCQLKSPDVVAKTMNLLRAATDQTQQMQYLYVLRNTSHGWTADDRRDYFQSLAQSQHYLGGQGMNDFLQRIRDEAVATLTDQERTALGSLLEPSPAPDETVGRTRALVQEWRVDDFSQLGGGDPVKGEQVFASAACSKCHRYGARGTMLGPDLTSASQRFSQHDLLVSILEPSKVIPESFRSLQIVTTDGQTYVGQASLSGDYRSSILRLATDPLAPTKFVEIEKKNIEVQKFAEVSWMPKGLLNTFNKQEIQDLLAYLHGSP